MIRLTVVQARTVIDHPEWVKERAKQAAWYQQNRDRVIAKVKQSAKDDPEAVLDRSRRYRARHPERRRESVRRSRARPGYRQAERLARRGGQLTEPARQYVRVLLGDLCGYCGAMAEQIDHIVPVAAGGTGEWDNLTAACGDCNRRKYARPLLIFLLERAR